MVQSVLGEIELQVRWRSWDRLIAARQQAFRQDPGIVCPREPVDIPMISRDLAEEKVHGPSAAKPHLDLKNSGKLHGLSDQAKLLISTSHVHSQAGYAATAQPSTLFVSHRANVA